MNKQEQQTMRETIARRLGYVQDDAWWIHPNGNSTSNDGLPSLKSLINDLLTALDVAEQPDPVFALPPKRSFEIEVQVTEVRKGTPLPYPVDQE